MNPASRIKPIVHNLNVIAHEQALRHSVGLDVDFSQWSSRYRIQLNALRLVLTEVCEPHAAVDQDGAVGPAHVSFAAGRHRLDCVVDWLLEKGFTVLACSVGGAGLPAVTIAYSEAAQQELCVSGAGRRVDGGRTFECYTAQRSGVRIWWEREIV